MGAVFCISRALRRTYSKRGVTPYYVLPADAASVEAMVVQIKAVLLEKQGVPMPYEASIRLALAAIGIKGGAK